MQEGIVRAMLGGKIRKSTESVTSEAGWQTNPLRFATAASSFSLLAAKGLSRKP